MIWKDWRWIEAVDLHLISRYRHSYSLMRRSIPSGPPLPNQSDCRIGPYRVKASASPTLLAVAPTFQLRAAQAPSSLQVDATARHSDLSYRADFGSSE